MDLDKLFGPDHATMYPCNHMGGFRPKAGEPHTQVCTRPGCEVEFCVWFPRAKVATEVLDGLLRKFDYEWRDMVKHPLFIHYTQKAGEQWPPQELKKREYMARRFTEVGKWNGWHQEDVERGLAGVACA